MTHGTGYTYGWAAAFGGIGIHAETDHSTATSQCDYWGNATRNDQLSNHNDGLHWVWGRNKKPSDNPKIFYNY